MSGDGLYQVNLDPEQAKHLAQQGATLLLLDVPQGTVLGVDQQMHLVGPKFKGVKMLQPGVHLVAYNSVSSQGDFSPTTSFFVHLEQRQVLVRRWDPDTELLQRLENEDEAEAYAAGVRRFDFDTGLAAYNLGGYSTWQQLSGYIDAATINRLAPTGHGNISIAAEAVPAFDSRSEAEQQLSRQLARIELTENHGSTTEQAATSGSQPVSASVPPREQSGVGRCWYTQIPRTAKRAGLSPVELTAANMDKSLLLEELIRNNYGGQANGILCELQFAFLAFLVGQSLEGFGQWKVLLHLLLGCQAAPLQKRPKLFARLLTALKAQLDFSLGNKPGQAQPAPMGVPMVEELLGDSFLKRLMAHFFDVLATAEMPLDANLKVASESLQKVLQDRLGWDFRVTELVGEESDDEFAPTVVDL